MFVTIRRVPSEISVPAGSVPVPVSSASDRSLAGANRRRLTGDGCSGAGDSGLVRG
jgi:hypothetical protein